jgi:thiosulfate/3-mercaptopyruvate sulfurtransferase
MYTTLISAMHLQQLMRQNAPLLVFDCSFELAKPQIGDAQYQDGHIPMALRADLDRHLSAHAPSPTASGGRHPLPTREAFAKWLANRGLTSQTQVVVYDRQGANYCGRLWWMLKWVGHEAVAVLDGGWLAWQALGGASETGTGRTPTPARYQARESLAKLVDAPTLLADLGQATHTVLDARAEPRYKGEVEPLDPVAGHIPGALNRVFTSNLTERGFFKPAAQLRAEFETLLAGRAPESVVHQCGSGVSALPNLIAMEVAGLGRGALYAGSWSDWCSDPSRPVAKG